MKESTRNIIMVFLFLTSVLLIGLGIHTQEHMTVLNKAINVCMECIGIG